MVIVAGDLTFRSARRIEHCMELNKPTVRHLLAMMESGLVPYKQYIPWADDQIVKIEKPPHWLLELATVKYKGDALRILGEFVDSEPFEEID